MEFLSLLTPVISHIVAALYLQKRKYSKPITACFWGAFTLFAVGMLQVFKAPFPMFISLLLAQFITFCLTTVGPLGEKTFLFLTYANSFSICIGVNLILSSFFPRGLGLLLSTTAVVALMHLFLYRVLIFKYKKAKQYFTSGWWKLIIVLILTLIQFLNQYAFKIVDKDSAANLLFDFAVFSVIFNTTLILIFDSVKHASETNKKAHENKILQDIAHRDALTKIPNRLAYNTFIKAQLKRKSDTSFVFTMLDIDDFKVINDTKGHAKGDETLRRVAAGIVKHFEPFRCHSFRIGGDEFVLLMEDASLTETEDQIQELNKKLWKNHKITLSHGCAAVDFEAENPFESAYKQADTIMYHNKQQKNVTV